MTNVDMGTMANLAFLPIDIKTPELNLKELNLLTDKLQIQCHTQFWNMLPVCGRLSDDEWFDPNRVAENWSDRYKLETPRPVRWSFNMDQLFPEVVSFLAALPFEKITTAYFLRQRHEVTAHLDLDTQPNNDFSGARASLEPCLYKLMIFDQSLRSFYVTPTKFSKLNYLSSMQGDHVIKIYPNFPEGYRCCVITEEKYYHGADYYPDSNKFVLSLFGILDHNKHERLIARSYKRFKEYAIFFE